MGRCQSCIHDHGSVQAILRTLGVLGRKHIPQLYLRASERQRRDLLARRLDVDALRAGVRSLEDGIARLEARLAALEARDTPPA